MLIFFKIEKMEEETNNNKEEIEDNKPVNANESASQPVSATKKSDLSGKTEINALNKLGKAKRRTAEKKPEKKPKIKSQLLQAETMQQTPLEKKNPVASFVPSFLKTFNRKLAEKKENRIKDKELKRLEEEVKALSKESLTKENAPVKPLWFHISSIFAVFLFTVYISVFAAMHFNSIELMRIMIIFLFVSMACFFLISAMRFVSEKNILHSAIAILFLFGLVSIMVYAFKAADISNLVRFSIIYTIIATSISVCILAIKPK